LGVLAVAAVALGVAVVRYGNAARRSGS